MSFYLASCIGLTLMLKYASIIKHYRQQLVDKDEFFKDLFSCSLCLGFWVGILHVPFVAVCETVQLKWLLLPPVSAGASWFVDSVLSLVQTLHVFIKKHTKD